MENKYYTPNIEDFYVGYEYEFQGVPKGWHKMKLDGSENFGVLKYNLEKLSDAIRTPYLTKEQIENEGWKFTAKSIDLWFEKEGTYERTSWTSYKAILHYNQKDNWTTILLMDVGEEEQIYHGKCPSINEFRYICKLLNI